MTEVPEGWECAQVALANDLTQRVETRPVYRRRPVPETSPVSGVIVLHEFPHMKSNMFTFADRLVERGHEVRMPSLFGTPVSGGPAQLGPDFVRFCIRREFAILARNRTSPVIGWLRALAREFSRDLGSEGVGVVGMCFTGGFALAMMADAPVLAPVLAEPSLPFRLGWTRTARDADDASLGMSSSDLDRACARATDVIGLRYTDDRMVGTRFDTLTGVLRERFSPIEFAGEGHSVLTSDAQPIALAAVEDFLDDKLRGGAGDTWRASVGRHPDGRVPLE